LEIVVCLLSDRG